MIRSKRLIHFYSLQLVMYNVPNFKNRCCSNSWEILKKKIKFWRGRRKRKRKGMISRRKLILSYPIRQVMNNVCINFETQSQWFLGNLEQNLMGWTEKWTKRMINRRKLLLFYSIQLVMHNICTKFLNCSCIGSWVHLK